MGNRVMPDAINEANGWPLQYLMAEAQFMGLDFVVRPGVFIPRPETEILVEAALKKIATRPIVFDLGTGCGNIAVSIAKFLADVRVFASDVSSLALGVGTLNARRHGVDNRVRFLEGEFFRPLGREKVDFILSNPPYIGSDDLKDLPPEVRHEPRIALDGGRDGLQVLKRIVEECPCHLKEGGYLILEVGYGQAYRVSEIIRKTEQFLEPEVIKDYNQINRVIVAKRA